MKYLMLACLLVVGCGNGEEVKQRPSSKDYRPTELLAMATPPTEAIVVEGKVTQSANTKQTATKGKVMVMVEDPGISTVENHKYIYAVFESGEKDFSESFTRWVRLLQDGFPVRINGKVMKTDKDTIYLIECEVK